MYEPRKLPEFRTRIESGYWYCLHCEQYRLGQSSIDAHVKATHAVSMPENGEDYADGDQIVRMAHRRHEWVTEQEKKFHRAVESLAGADDLIYEVKDGSGVPPYA